MASNKRNLVILFLVLVVVMMGFGIVIPLLPFLVAALNGGGREVGLMMAIFGLAQLFFSPVWGGLSDRFGRKPILMIGVLGFALSQLLFGLSTELWMLYGSRALAGTLSSAAIPTTMAYISDSTSEEDRGAGMGILGAAMGLGIVIGPGLGGILGRNSLSLPFFVAAGISVLVLLPIYFFLPESLPPERRVTAAEQQRSVGGAQLKLMWQALRYAGPLGFLFFLAFLISFGITNFEGIFGLFAKDRFGFDQEQVGYILTAIGVTAFVVQGGLTGPLTRRFGDERVFQGSLLISAIGFGLMLAAGNMSTIILTSCFFMVGNALTRPSIASLVSKRAGQSQGMAMGLNNSFMSLGRVVGPLWAGFVYDANIGLPYLSGGIIMAIGLAATLIWLNPKGAEPAPTVLTSSK